MIRNILIAEDQPEACSSLVQTLQLETSHTLVVFRCASGEDALERLRQSVASGQFYDAILTDGYLEGFAGGVTIITTLRNTLPEYNDTPVIASSSDANYFNDVAKHPVYGRNLYQIPKLTIGPRETCWDDDAVADTLKSLNVL